MDNEVLTMQEAPLFGEAYQAEWHDESARSAAVIVPLLMDIFPTITSVVDIGCGTASWLYEFERRGVQRIAGLDIAAMPSHLLQVDPRHIQRCDLRHRFRRTERFDLALCLQVAQYLPPDSADQFIEQVAQIGDIVIFGAAAPGQTHLAYVNERWPSYWIEIFLRNGLRCFDVLRSKVWYDYRVNWRYSQNTFVFVRNSRNELIEHFSASAAELKPIDIVHPRAYEESRASSGTAPNSVFFPFKLVEEGFDTFNIIQINTNQYLALAQEEGAYIPEKFVSNGYRKAFLAESIEGAKARVEYHNSQVGPKWRRSSAMRLKKFFELDSKGHD